MANEIKVQYQPDEANVYACVFNADKQVYDVVGNNWETWDDAQIDNYDIVLTENGGGGMFYGDFPAAIAAGRYSVTAFQGAKTATDKVLGSGNIVWNGSAEVFDIDTSGRVDVGKVLGDTPMDEDSIADAILVDGSTNKLKVDADNRVDVGLIEGLGATTQLTAASTGALNL